MYMYNNSLYVQKQTAILKKNKLTREPNLDTKVLTKGTHTQEFWALLGVSDSNFDADKDPTFPIVSLHSSLFFLFLTYPDLAFQNDSDPCGSGLDLQHWLYLWLYVFLILSCDFCFPLYLVYFLVHLMSLLFDDIASGILAIACISAFTSITFFKFQPCLMLLGSLLLLAFQFLLCPFSF